MGLFGRKRVAGISEHELQHDHIQAQFDSVFPSYKPSSKTKRAALRTALSLAVDRDMNMSAGQKGGLIQKEEFETIVKGLLDGSVITETEAEKLRAIAEKPLKD
jgi:uncharacterized protein YutE (UPF0331/DUF86 family)